MIATGEEIKNAKRFGRNQTVLVVENVDGRSRGAPDQRLSSTSALARI